MGGREGEKEGQEVENERKLVVVRAGQGRTEYNGICVQNSLKLC